MCSKQDIDLIKKGANSKRGLPTDLGCWAPQPKVSFKPDPMSDTSSGSSCDDDDWQTWEARLEEAKGHNRKIEEVKDIEARRRPLWRLIKIEYVPPIRKPRQGPVWPFKKHEVICTKNEPINFPSTLEYEILDYEPSSESDKEMDWGGMIEECLTMCKKTRSKISIDGKENLDPVHFERKRGCRGASSRRRNHKKMAERRRNRLSNVN